MFEEAATVAGMIGMCKMTQREIAKKLGVSQSYVANKVRLLGFSEAMKKSILQSGVTERHARALLRLPTEEMRRRALATVAEGKMTVAVTEILVERMLDEAAANGEENGKKAPPSSEGLSAFEALLDRSIVTLKRTGATVAKSVTRAKGRTLITLEIS